MFIPTQEITNAFRVWKKSNRSVQDLEKEITNILVEKHNISNPELHLRRYYNMMLIDCLNPETFFAMSGLTDKVEVVDSCDDLVKFKYSDGEYHLTTKDSKCITYQVRPLEYINVNVEIAN